MKESNFTGFVSLIKHIPGFDSEYAVEAIGGSESLYEKMLIKTVRLIPVNIEKMEEVLSKGGNLDAFTVIVHGVKGSLAQVGCLELARQAGLLEDAARKGEKAYCVEHYGPFREKLLRFYTQVNEALLQSAGMEPEEDSENMGVGNINDFFDTLMSAKKAVEDFDSIAAAEILLPLTKRRFGGNMDTLISKAADALEAFRPRKALEYIDELINECKESAWRPEKEEDS